MHAGFIAAACTNPYLKAGHKVSHEDFMLKSAEKRRADDTAQSLEWLMSVAKPK